MDRLIYTVLTGLAGRDRGQAVTANNLANAGTSGFRREVIAAEGRYLTTASLPTRAESPGARSRAQAGAPSRATPQVAGRIAATARDLDIALAGNSWLAIQGPVVGGAPTEAYTRRGDLSVTVTGLLVNGDGKPVLGDGGTPVTVPAGAALSIAPDGSLSARIGGIDTAIGRLKLVAAAAGDLEKGADGQFTARTPLPVDAGARLTSGALEASNVEVAGALAELVEQSRGFEINSRLLGIAKDLDERTARLMALDSQ